ncbi:hypothetical protein EVAR_59140_1 [Eumeta japonica]|uniref:Uncharacterized protein n=1 Tax=Eumeta variegata TaxID=151549 RepID=A0A4C1ZBL7_EUMVA|nr:hypothetical protein EVAR_59140_1 [Eumeta japonica]
MRSQDKRAFTAAEAGGIAARPTAARYRSDGTSDGGAAVVSGALPRRGSARIIDLFTKAGEKKKGSGSVAPAQCNIHEQLRAVKFRATDFTVAANDRRRQLDDSVSDLGFNVPSEALNECLEPYLS